MVSSNANKICTKLIDTQMGRKTNQKYKMETTEINVRLSLVYIKTHLDNSFFEYCRTLTSNKIFHIHV